MPGTETVNSVNVSDRSNAGKTAILLTGNPKPAGKTFATAADAVAAERRQGPRSAMWTYQTPTASR